MKTKYDIMILTLFLLVLVHCGGSADGGTETGTTSSGAVDTSTVGTKIDAAGAALVLNIAASDVSSSISSPHLRFAIDGTAGEWASYIDSDNAYVLTDVFGSEDEEPRVVTKIRVLLSQFASNVQSIFSGDADFSCDGGLALNGGDTLDVAFYDDVANGDSSDRFFDCVVDESDDDDTRVTLYGQDAESVIRIVDMSDSTSDNAEDTTTRGDSVRIMASILSTYAEATEDGLDVVYLDLQFAHGSVYNGPDDSFGTDDDMTFKSRSRITGRVELDADGNPSLGEGEFRVTKYDSSNGNEIVTMTRGRGAYGSGDYSIFSIDSNVSTLVGLDGTFCIQTPEGDSTIPDVADAADCTSLETVFAWGLATFPFDLVPDISATFADNAMFEGNDTDLVANDGSNFTIPTY